MSREPRAVGLTLDVCRLYCAEHSSGVMGRDNNSECDMAGPEPWCAVHRMAEEVLVLAT